MAMRDRVTLRQREAGRNAAGEPVDTWTSLPDVWADVLFPTGAAIIRAGTEGIHADSEMSVVRISIRIWADPSVNATMRIQFLGTEYDIKSVIPDAKDRRFMFLVCVSVT